MSAAAVDWVAQHGAELEGLASTTAEARVRDAGLTPRTLAPDTMVTLEFRPDRVDLHCDPDGIVRSVRAG